MKSKLLLTLLAFLLLTGLQSQAQTNDLGKGADSLQCKEQLSLYREYYKIKVYNLAFPHWRWMLLNCPKATQNIYIDGVKILNDVIEKTQDTALKNKYIDTLLMVYDQRIKYYNREGFVLGRKAVDAIEYKPSLAKKAYPWLSRSVELQGIQSEGAVLVYYLNTAVKLAGAGTIDKSEIFTVYDKVISIAEQNVANFAADEKNLSNWVKIKMNIEAIIEPLASCTDLVKIYEKKFNETPDDVQLLKNITNMLDKRNCTAEGTLFFRATERLHKLEPSAQSAFLMGRLSVQNNQNTRAAEYFAQAAELFTDTTNRVRALFALANTHMSNRNFSQARSSAQRILSISPNDGRAYILIGDLYAMSANMCEGDDLSGKTVFWTAVDKYIKAKSVDQSVEAQANEKISQYSRYYPASSDLFFRDMQEGTPYTVGCWINETTTIRGIK